jgi:hypothetical protein
MKRTAMLVALMLSALIGWKSAWAASSEENRDERTVLLEVTPLGLHPATLLAFPMVGAGVYLGKNWLIGAEYGSHTYSLDTGSNNGKVDGTFTNQGISARWFPGTNSFNLGLAVNQRSWDVNFKYTITSSLPGLGDIPVKAKLKTDAIVPAFIVGNQWMTDFGMVIGLDWVILSAPASTSVTGSYDLGILSALTTQADRNEANKQLKDGGDYLNMVSGFPGLLVLNIGYAF